MAVLVSVLSLLVILLVILVTLGGWKFWTRCAIIAILRLPWLSQCVAMQCHKISILYYLHTVSLCSVGYIYVLSEVMFRNG